MKRCLGACLLSTLFACQLNPARQCTKDSDCLGTDVCDVAVHSCVTNPSADGGPNIGWTLTLTAPVDGARVNASASATAQLTFFGGSTPTLPASVTLSATPTGNVSTLAKSGANTYVGSLPSGLVTDQLYTLQAAYPNGLADGGTVVSNTVSVTFDNVAPVFTVTVLPPPSSRTNTANLTVVDPTAGFDGGQAYRRDEIATVQVTSTSTDVDGGSVRLTVLGTDAGAVPIALALVQCAGTGYCGQASVDMSIPDLAAFDGYFTLSATGADSAGNLAGASGSVGVTRWKWRRDLSGGSGFSIKASPAIGHLGSIYVGTTAGGSASSLYALNPDGGLIWQVPVGSVTASPAVGAWDGVDEAVYVGANIGSAGVLYALAGSTGADGGTYSAGGVVDVPGSLLIASTTFSGETGESAVAVMELNTGNNGRLVAFRPTTANPSLVLDTNVSYAPYPGNIVTDGTTYYFGDIGGQVENYTIVSSVWTETMGFWPRSIIGGQTVTSLALGPSSLFGVSAAGIHGGILGLALPNGPETDFPTIAGASPAYGIVLTSQGAGEALFGDSTKLNRIPFDLSALDASPLAGGDIHAAPILGADGRTYTADTSGGVLSWSGALAPEWKVPLALGSFEASPTVDCTRDAAGNKLARPAVLYAGNDDGRLYAIIIDSHGLDATALWPKYQHDPRNTGNTSTSLTEFQCP